jgi:hypothetical protein
MLPNSQRTLAGFTILLFEETSTTCMDLLPGEYGRGDSSNRIIAYLDADFARDVTDRKSRTEFTTIVNGGPISWGK